MNPRRRIGALSCGLLPALFLVFSALGLCDSAMSRMIGTWRGTSTCVNREAAPACNDEQVVYEIAAAPGKENAVSVKADKIVEGKRVPMGELEFTRDATDGQWFTEFQSARVHARWMLSPHGNTMTGTMILLPAKVVVRKIELHKEN